MLTDIDRDPFTISIALHLKAKREMLNEIIIHIESYSSNNIKIALNNKLEKRRLRKRETNN